ncbi:CapA family protein [Nocardioides sp. YIM 152315]|uniref:CapA family protein n=1 Tax=Nocardioides sp. YIM 152315 TaxID=3031760 RepID=UPI0023DA2A50|nr:CapA family protein [Nocardioides sp. YIM 152315]MDF1604355.1 CapA family protein [Nocardioides sp. YIM 152315]
MRLLVGCVLVLALAGCTDDAEPEPVDRAITEVPSSSPSDSVAPSTRPLVLAVNARRPALALTLEQARRLRRGAIDDWRRLGQPAGPLRTTERTVGLRHLPMDTVAVVSSAAVGPAVRVATVDGVDPLRDPAAYPLQVAGPTPAEVTTLTVVGDVMLGRGVTGLPVLEPMSGRLADAELTVGNLESTLSDDGPPRQGGDSFHAPPSVRGELRDAGFDAIDLANNHTGDYGDRALVDTVRLLREGDLPTFGAGRDLARARKPVVLERDGVRFGFLGFNAIGETPEAGPGRPGAVSVSMPPRTGPLDRAELDRFLGDVRRLSRRVDVVVVLPHWGTQYTHRPEPIQHRVARQLAGAGADLVVGGHPHWVQGAELVRGPVDDTLVVHSLGNFTFDMTTPQTREGLVLEATFWGGRLMAANFVPYRMDADLAPRPVPREKAGSILDPFWELSSLAAPR